MAETIEVAKGEFLIRVGEESTCMYLLKKGTMAVIREEDGEASQIGTIYAGELVGEMSFLDKNPRSASVQAINDCELTMIPGERFEKTFNSLPNWYQALIKTLLDRLRRANAKIKV